MKRVGFRLAMVVGVLALAACGETTGDRGLSGAGIGAAVGGDACEFAAPTFRRGPRPRPPQLFDHTYALGPIVRISR